MAIFPLGIVDQQLNRLAPKNGTSPKNNGNSLFKDTFFATAAIDISASLGIPVTAADSRLRDEPENSNHKD